MNNIGPTFVAVIGGIIALAMVAVLVSKKAQSPAVIQSTGSALSSIINAAVSPVVSGGGNTFGGIGQ
jgi:membrane DNA delivery protein